jgi:hypothetical protein
VNSVFAIECAGGFDEQCVCNAVCRGVPVESVLAMQCAERFWGTAILLCRVQSGSGEQRAGYAVCRVVLVNSVLAMHCAEWFW